MFGNCLDFELLPCQKSHFIISGAFNLTGLPACVFISQGNKQEGDENAYDKKSDVYMDLVTLLKSTSPHFAENASEQVTTKPQNQNRTMLSSAVRGRY